MSTFFDPEYEGDRYNNDECLDAENLFARKREHANSIPKETGVPTGSPFSVLPEKRTPVCLEEFGCHGLPPSPELLSHFFSAGRQNRSSGVIRHVPAFKPAYFEKKDVNPYSQMRVFVKPARQKYTKFSPVFPPFLTKRSYQVVVWRPESCMDIAPNFFLRGVKQDEQVYNYLKGAVSTKEISNRRVKQQFRGTNGVVTKYQMTLNVSTNNRKVNMEKKKPLENVMVCIRDMNNSGVEFYRSGPLKVYARKHKMEKEYWLRFYDYERENEDDRKKWVEKRKREGEPVGNRTRGRKRRKLGDDMEKEEE